MRYATSIVLAVLGLAAAAPAQFRIGFSDSRFHVEARIGSCEPVRYAPHRGHVYAGYERVWVPGCYRVEHVPATYGWVYDLCGHRAWGIVTPACTRRVYVPGCWETRPRHYRGRC
jgi:hypothetical protein